MTKIELVKAFDELVGKQMLLLLSAYEPLAEDEWYALMRMAHEDTERLPDPETFQQERGPI